MIPINSKTLRYGLGCFETIKLFPPNKPAFLQPHLERLLVGMNVLSLNTFTLEEIKAKVKEYLLLNTFSTTQVMRILITEEEGISIFTEPYEEKENHLSLVSSSDWFIDSRSPLNNFKSFNYLKNYLAKLAAQKEGFSDALLLNERDEIAESTSANLFFKTLDKTWITPNLQSGCLPGVIRKILIGHLGAEEKVIEKKDLREVVSVLAVNSLVEVQSVMKIGDYEYLTAQEINEIKSFIREEGLKS